MKKYKLDLDIDNKDYYYRITRNKTNHLVQQKCNRPLHSKNDVMRLSTNESLDTIDEISSVSVNNCLEELKRQNLKELVSLMLSSLQPREERVLRMRFGINTKQHTLEDVGIEFSVTRDRIRQIESKALRKLKHPSRSKELKDYLKDYFEVA